MYSYAQNIQNISTKFVHKIQCAALNGLQIEFQPKNHLLDGAAIFMSNLICLLGC